MPEIMGYEWVFDVYDADVSYGNTLAVRFLKILKHATEASFAFDRYTF
jgi:hypothetical protein